METMERNYLNVKDIRERFEISKTSAYNLMKLKGFPSVRLGRKYIVAEEDLYSFMDEHKGGQIFIE